MNTEIKIYSTTDYELFKVHPQQPREPKRTANTSLTEKIRASGRNLSIATISKDMYIVDGHRRIDACKKAKVPFIYEIIDFTAEETVTTIKDMNVTADSWGMKNYISSYATVDKDYRKLQQFIKEEKVPVSFFTSLTQFNEVLFRNMVSIKGMDWKQASHRANVYRVICSLFPESKTNDVHRALGALYNTHNFVEETLLTKLEKLVGGSVSVAIRNKKQFLIDLSNVHDKGLSASNKVLPELIATGVIKL